MDAYFAELSKAAGALAPRLERYLENWRATAPDPLEYLRKVVCRESAPRRYKKVGAALMDAYFPEEPKHKVKCVSPTLGYSLNDLYDLFTSSVRAAEALEQLDLEAFAKAYLDQVSFVDDLRAEWCATVPTGLFLVFFLVRSMALLAEGQAQPAAYVVEDLKGASFYAHLARHLLGRGFFEQTLIYTNSVAHQILHQAAAERSLERRLPQTPCAVAFATLFLSSAPAFRLLAGREGELLAFWSNSVLSRFQTVLSTGRERTRHICPRLYRATFCPAGGLAPDAHRSLYAGLYALTLSCPGFYSTKDLCLPFLQAMERSKAALRK